MMNFSFIKSFPVFTKYFWSNCEWISDWIQRLLRLCWSAWYKFDHWFRNIHYQETHFDFCFNDPRVKMFVLRFGSFLFVNIVQSRYSRWAIGYGSLNFTNLTMLSTSIALMHNNVLTNFWPNRNDIGLIILPNDVNSGKNWMEIFIVLWQSTIISDLVEPISLPITTVPLPRDNEEGLVVGFTYTNQTGQPDANSVLNGVYLQTIASNRCISNHIIGPLQNTFCASDPYYSSNSCTGSVGSGFVVRSRGEDLLVSETNGTLGLWM